MKLPSPEEMKTQDCCSTSYPVYLVFTGEKRGPPEERFLGAFFSLASAQEFCRGMKLYRHPKAYVYVASGYENQEWRDIRLLLEETGPMADMQRENAELRKRLGEAESKAALYAHRIKRLNLSCSNHSCEYALDRKLPFVGTNGPCGCDLAVREGLAIRKAIIEGEMIVTPSTTTPHKEPKETGQ